MAFNTGKKVVSFIRNIVEPEIKKLFGTELKVKSGKGKWDAEDQLRQAVWQRIEADKKRSKPVKQHDDADSDEEAVQGGDENDGDADADDVADADDAADAAAADGAAAAAAAAGDDDTARKGDVEAEANDDADPELAPKEFNYPQAACVRLYSRFCIVWGFEYDDAMSTQEIDEDAGKTCLFHFANCCLKTQNVIHLLACSSMHVVDCIHRRRDR